MWSRDLGDKDSDLERLQQALEDMEKKFERRMRTVVKSCC